MQEIIKARDSRLREYFEIASGVELTRREQEEMDVSADIEQHLKLFNLEWHIIPSSESVPFDDRYIERLYPMRARDFDLHDMHSMSYRERLRTGHARHQGYIIAVETTPKPRYLPENRQYYGTAYGFDHTADPFAEYLGRANFLSGTRFAHDYISLRAFIDVVNKDWRTRKVMPRGYRLTICPPAVFNLIGNVFHPEWSETETLELGFYRDEHGNANCYGVGSNAPGDFSYIRRIDSDSDWTLLGFRTALVPE